MDEAPAGAPVKVVLDTNVLVGAAYAPGSAGRAVVEACLRGELALLLSPALRREYEHIQPRAVRASGQAGALRQLLQRALVVEPAGSPRLVPDDPEDDKVLAAALAGGADALVTSDRHLLTLDPCGTVRIVRPAAFVRLWRLGMLAPPRAGRPRRAEAVSAFPLTGAPAGLGWRRSRPQPGASGRPAGQRSRDDLARPKGPTSGRPAPGGVRAAPGLTPA